MTRLTGVAALAYHGQMSWDRLKGKFVVLDGPDGAGKSTQVSLLNDVMRKKGLESVMVRDPGGTAIGERIRDLLLDRTYDEMSVRCEVLLYMASRAQLFSEKIEPALKRGQCVICDRWVSSTYAYQAVAGRVGPDLVVKTAESVLDRSWPDLTIILDVPSDLGLQRVGEHLDRMEGKGANFHHRVRRAFLDLADAREDFRVVDGVGPIEAVHQRVREVMESYVTA